MVFVLRANYEGGGIYAAESCVSKTDGLNVCAWRAHDLNVWACEKVACETGDLAPKKTYACADASFRNDFSKKTQRRTSMEFIVALKNR